MGRVDGAQTVAMVKFNVAAMAVALAVDGVSNGLGTVGSHCNAPSISVVSELIIRISSFSPPIIQLQSKLA